MTSLSNSTSKPNQFAHIFLSYLDLNQYEMLTQKDPKTDGLTYLWDNYHPALALIQREGIDASYKALKEKYFSKFNGQVRLLQEEAWKSNIRPTADSLLPKIVRARNAVFQSITRDEIPPDSLCHFIPSGVDEWINDLSEENLIKAYSKANEVGDFEITQKMIASKRLERISNAPLIGERDVVLRQSFIVAASKGYIEIIQTVIGSVFYKKVPGYALCEALLTAAERGYSDILKAIISTGRLRELSNEKIEMLFKIASEKGLSDAVRDIISSPQFRNISKKALSNALLSASEKGHLDVAVAIITSNRLRDIAAENLGLALLYAVSEENVAMTKAFLSSPRAEEISSMYFLTALELAGPGAILSWVQSFGPFPSLESVAWIFKAKGGNSELIASLIASPLYQKIPSQDAWSITCRTCENKHFDVASMLMSSRCFHKISYTSFVSVLKEVANSGSADLTEMLLSSLRSGDITLENKALQRAVRHGNVEIIISLIASPQYQKMPCEKLWEVIWYTCLHEHFDVALDLLSSGYFNDIPHSACFECLLNVSVTCHRADLIRALLSPDRTRKIDSPENYIGTALAIAADQGYLETVNAFISSSLFQKLPKEDFEVVVYSASRKHKEVLLALVDSTLFPDVSMPYLSSLLEKEISIPISHNAQPSSVKDKLELRLASVRENRRLSKIFSKKYNPHLYHLSTHSSCIIA